MKKRIILTILSIVCILTSCTPMTYELPEVSFDPTTTSARVAGFQLGMSARMAKRVAKQQGYSLYIHSDITFDDIAEGRLEGADNIFLNEDYEWPYKRRCEQGTESVSLRFSYGRLESIHYKCTSCPRQEAEELLTLYLARYPQMTLERETEEENYRSYSHYRSYSYEPNSSASIKALIRMINEKNGRVDISVYDGNYSQSIRNQELQERIDAIRQRY